MAWAMAAYGVAGVYVTSGVRSRGSKMERPVAVLPDVTGDGPAVFGFIRHRQSGYIGACVVVYRCTLSIATSIDFNLCYLIFKINGGNFPRMNAILKFQLVVLALPQTPGACHRFRSHLNTLTMTTRLSSTLEAVD